MSVFIGSKTKRVELAERKDATNPNLLLNSKGPFQPQNSNITGYDNWQIYPDSTAYLEQGQTYTISGKTNGTWSGTHNGSVESDRCVIWFIDGADDATATIVSSDNQVNNSNQFVWANPTGTYQLRVNGYKPDNSTKAWNIKVEKGSVATPWCPALEDYAWQSDITNLQNTVNNINSTRTPIVAGASGDDLFAFETNQIRLYSGNGSTCKNLPPAANTNFFTVQYVFENPNEDGIAIYRTPYSEIWTAGCNGGSYTSSLSGGGWTRVANSTDVSNLQSMITGLSTKVDSLQQNSLKIVPITQADYDNLNTKDPNTIYAIGG